MKHLLRAPLPRSSATASRSRDFTYVEDVAELCVKASHAPGVAGKMYNAGNGGRIHAEIRCGTCCRRWKASRSLRRYTARRAQATCGIRWRIRRRAVAELGHAPRFTIEEGLKRTLEWYRHAGDKNPA